MRAVLFQRAASVIGALLFSAFAAATTSQYRVEEIEFEGLEVAQDAELSIRLEIAVGDELNRERVVESAKGIQEVYTSKGYWSAEVRPQVKILRSEKDDEGMRPIQLTFRVEEGEPVRVSAFRINLNKSSGDLSIGESLSESLGFRSGTIFTQDFLRTAQRQIESKLASAGFVGGSVSEPKVKVSAAPSDPKVKAMAASRWVSIDLSIFPGQEVTFGFRGNNVVSRPELMSIIDDQRVLGLTENYAEEIRQQISAEYRRRGFASNGVSVRTFEPNNSWNRACQARSSFFKFKVGTNCKNKMGRTRRRVTFVIEEGPKVKIANLKFEGNFSFTDRELGNQFYSFGSSLLQRSVYVAEDVERAARAVVDWMKTRGFLSAKLVDISQKEIEKSPNIDLTIYLNEGVQTTLKSIKLAGVTRYQREDVLEVLGIDEGQPLDLFRFTEGIEALKAKYQKDTHLNVRILNEGENSVVTYSQKNRLADVTLFVDEGLKYRVSRIQILGLGGTSESVIRNEIVFEEGDLLSLDDVTLSESRLRRIGIFSSVSIAMSDDLQKEGFKIVRIRVREGTPGYYGFTLGFRNDLGVRISGEAGYSNLLGLNHSIDVDVSVNRRIENYKFVESAVSFQYRIPHLGFPKLQMSPSVNWEDRRFINFDARTISGRLFFARPFWRDQIIPSFIYNFESTEQSGDTNLLNNGQLRIGSVIPGIRLDLRDSPLNPTKGIFVDIRYEIASPYLGSQDNFEISFNRLDYRMDFHYPFWRFGFYASFRTGWAKNYAPLTDPSSGLPLIRQFWLGGIGSVRGFRLQDINLFNTIVQGSMSFVNYRFQIDVSLSESLKVGPFLDAGNLRLDSYSMMNGLRAGAGVGLRYSTPVGPINLDWGYKLDPQPGEERYRVHLSVGVL